MKMTVGGVSAEPTDKARVKGREETRAVIVAPFSDPPGAGPVSTTRCRTEDALYDTYRPSVDFDCIDENGETRQVTVEYHRVDDFDRRALRERVEPIRRKVRELEVLRYLLQELTENSRLRARMAEDPEAVLATLMRQRPRIEAMLRDHDDD